jgi:zinc protease
MKLQTLLALSLTGLSLLAAAGPGKPKAFPYAYDQYDLDNGLRVVTVPTSYPNVVALYIVVQAGSRNEVEAGKTGFAHFFEHMMFRGTKEFPPAKFQSVLQEAGAANNAFTSDDLTVYHTTFSKPDLEMFMRMEADRFQNLDYSLEGFQTESLAVLGEYNKNSASPFLKLSEVLRDTAFKKHTYAHTTMGYLADIKDMPNQFTYSKEFFQRFYRPEYTTILIVGDVQSEQVRTLANRYWKDWKRGSYTSPVEAEPPQTAPRSAHIDWPTPTLPISTMAFRAPAYSDTEKDYAALDLIAELGFSQNSPLYKALILDKQQADSLRANNGGQRDPYLFTIMARVKKKDDLPSVQEQVLSTLAGFKDSLVAPQRLDRIRRNLRYGLALSMDNSEAIARTLAYSIALRRTPDTLNKLAEVYESITPEDIRETARKYFKEDSRTIVTLTGAAK